MQNGEQYLNGEKIIFDDIKHSFYISDMKINILYQDVIDCSLIETKGNMGKGGIARAFSSDLMGDQNYISTSLCIHITTIKDAIKIELIKTPLKSNNFIYKKLLINANELVDKINSSKPNKVSKPISPDYIDELRELRKLVDEKILTEEEFNQRKKLILNTH